MTHYIDKFISLRRIAIAGYSRNNKKFGNYVYDELNKKGIQVFAINPNEKEINGVKCYSNIIELNNKIDGIFICVSRDKVVEILKEAASIGIKNIWLQQGAESKEAIETAQKLQLEMVYGKCLLMYMQPIQSFHKFHRTIWSWIGKL